MFPNYTKEANEQVCLLVQAETCEALKNLEAIANTPGVDGVFIGPADLSASLGHVGDPNHPEVQDAIEKAISDSKATAIMHFAAHALVGESMVNPSKYFHNNVACGLNLLDAMVRQGIKRFVFSSTCATFGIPSKMPIDESMPQHPINPYGESKLIFEKILYWYGLVHGITFVALRYFNAAGASKNFGEDHRIETHLIPNVLQVALGKKENVEVYGTDYPTLDGTCIRDYIHVIDLAQAHLLALHAKESAFYNLGTGGGTSVKEVIECARRITNHPIPILEKPRRAGDPPLLIGSSDKITRELGWKPSYQSINKIIQSAWLWHAEHPSGYRHGTSDTPPNK
jgi:UDP-glucose 4-epimerase